MPHRLRNLIGMVIELKGKHSYNGNYIGFIWVIIPKIIINLKLAEHKEMGKH
jgi:ABC-type polysaccharide/polyol phosphate export permease